MINQVEIEGIVFERIIAADELKAIAKRCAEKIREDYKNKDVVFLVILNGAFVFAADLLREYQLPCMTHFIKVSSYEGMESTSQVKIIGLQDSDLYGKNVVIVEDIVDSGLTMRRLLDTLNEKKVKSVEICTLFFKPDNFKGDYNIKYIGKEIENDFIVGYGLDLNNQGRNLADVYQKKN
ncbi:MAG: hypoxanthine phosphoribosyltransferase [Bacteroidales bacterium]|nr:hypoxanthine phosphoribosyltransferase [Bacteroidales bacterium]